MANGLGATCKPLDWIHGSLIQVGSGFVGSANTLLTMKDEKAARGGSKISLSHGGCPPSFVVDMGSAPIGAGAGRVQPVNPDEDG